MKTKLKLPRRVKVKRLDNEKGAQPKGRDTIPLREKGGKMIAVGKGKVVKVGKFLPLKIHVGDLIGISEECIVHHVARPASARKILKSLKIGNVSKSAIYNKLSH